MSVGIHSHIAASASFSAITPQVQLNAAPLETPGKVLNYSDTPPENYLLLMQAIWASHDGEAIEEQEVRRLADLLSEQELNTFMSLSHYWDKGGGATTPLVEAAKLGQLGIVKILVEFGAKSYFEYSQGEVSIVNALKFAASKGHPEVVKYLQLQGDPQKNIFFNYRSQSILELSYTLSSPKALECLQLLATHKNTTAQDLNDALNAAFEDQNKPVVELLLSCGATVSKEALLMKAAERNKIEMLKFLMERGVDLNYRDPKTGITALHVAAAHKNLKLVQFLLDHNVDPSPLTTAEYPFDRSFIKVGLNYLEFAKQWQHYSGVNWVSHLLKEPENIKYCTCQMLEEPIKDIIDIHAVRLQNENTLLFEAVEQLIAAVIDYPGLEDHVMMSLIRVLITTGHVDPSIPNEQNITPAQRLSEVIEKLKSAGNNVEVFEKFQAELFIK